MAGELGDPPGGWPEPFRSKIMKGRSRLAEQAPLSDEQRVRLQRSGAERQSVLNELLFPAPTKEFLANREQYGDVSVIDTLDYLYGLRLGEETLISVEPGVDLYVELEAISEVDDHGMRTVLASLNGQTRPVTVPDRSVSVDIPTAEKADSSNPAHVAAPFAGVTTVKVSVGDSVEEGDTIATIEAMKMEAAITATVSGVVERLATQTTQSVEAGDLLVVLTVEG